MGGEVPIVFSFELTESPYQIDKDIPIPSRHIKWSRFPFNAMDIGDSFFVTKKAEKKTSLIQLTSYLFLKQKEYRIESGHDAKFLIKKYRELDGCRVFRIE